MYRTVLCIVVIFLNVGLTICAKHKHDSFVVARVEPDFEKSPLSENQLVVRGCVPLKKLSIGKSLWVFDCSRLESEGSATKSSFRNNKKSKSKIDELVESTNEKTSKAGYLKHKHHHEHHAKAAQRQTPTDMRLRMTSTDPLFENQWHLRAYETENFEQYGDYDIDDDFVWSLNVEAAWEMGYTGKGVVVGVVDDGFQITHPDIYLNAREDLSYNVYDDTHDPTPAYSSYHGVACSGLIAASFDNNVCGAGVAPDAQLAGVKLLGGSVSDLQQGEAISHECASSMVDIYSNSWGPEDDGKTLYIPGMVTTSALEECTEKGRNGKGCVYVWAAGNGRGNGDNCAYDGLVNDPRVITVGAVDKHGMSSFYSEWGGSVFCVAPSSDSRTGVSTCDQSGGRGKNSGDCMSTFGGTSAAAPMVSGVIALGLQANPNMTWQGVQLVLAMSCRGVHFGDSKWQQNAAGIWHSIAYGYGIPDARLFVENAMRYRDRSGDCVYGEQEEIDGSLTDNLTGNVKAEFILTTEPGTLMHVACFKLQCNGVGLGYIDVTLESPSGTLFPLATGRRTVDKDRKGIPDGTEFCQRGVFGEYANGVWKMNAMVSSPTTVQLDVKFATASFYTFNAACLEEFL